MHKPITTAACLTLNPQRRLDIIDVTQKLVENLDAKFDGYLRLLFCSLHTTAGYLHEQLATKLGPERQSIDAYVRSAQRLFPEGAPYWHDQMHLRDELSEEQRKHEPLNADSHLSYICLGLANCVTYSNNLRAPIHFIDLDGKFNGSTRSRKSWIVGYNATDCIHESIIEIPIPPKHAQAINLTGSDINLLGPIQRLIHQHKIHRGLVTIDLDEDEKYAGLTVNEFETLLVEKDLITALLDPLRYVVRNSPKLLRDPLSIPSKAQKFLTSELKRIVPEVLNTASRNVSRLEYIVERLGFQVDFLEYIIDRLAAPSEARWMNLGRHINLLINSERPDKTGSVYLGTYQSPILIQWRHPDQAVRRLVVRLHRFC